MYGGVGCIAFDVFIASPHLPELRSAIASAIQTWNRQQGPQFDVYLIDRQWEQLTPRLAGPAQERQIDPLVDSSDILIGVFARNKKTEGTLHEVQQFLRRGKGDTAVVYLPDETADEDVELGQIRKALREHGIVGHYTDERHLLESIGFHLGQAVKVLLRRSDSWTRLCRNLAGVYESAPLPFARLIVNDFLRTDATKAAQIRDVCDGFQTTGLESYVTRVHHLVAAAKPGTVILAVCGEKGLGDYKAHRRYFRPFYDLSEKDEKVYRAFVRLKTGGHSQVIDQCIRDHTDSGAYPLEITMAGRAKIDQTLPGLCDDLDAGFGAVLFVALDGSSRAVVHAGVDLNLRWAELGPSIPLTSTVRMLSALFDASEGAGCHDAQDQFQRIRITDQ